MGWRLTRVVIGLMLRSGPGPFDLKSLAANDNGETMEAWSRRVLGERVHEYVVRPLIEPLRHNRVGRGRVIRAPTAYPAFVSFERLARRTGPALNAEYEPRGFRLLRRLNWQPPCAVNALTW
ncbi:hypothetical protein ACW2Q0_20495 [Nocardia sp. R16R-3T]